MMDWGFTIPKDHISEFLFNTPLAAGTSREITLVWDKKKYIAKGIKYFAILMLYFSFTLSV